LGFLQINDVNAVALTENVFLHFRVAAPNLMAEVNSRLKQFFHRNRSQTSFSFCELVYVLAATIALAGSNQSGGDNGFK